MTANEFFESQLITDANSVIDKNAHKFSRSDLIKFATAYHKSEVKNLNIPFVNVSVCDCEELNYGYGQPVCNICNKVVDVQGRKMRSFLFKKQTER